MPLQATSGAASYDGFGGGVAAVPQYIEDVFSTYLYTGTGTGATQTITNGIDLSTKGGLVWAKSRTTAGDNHILVDTARGVNTTLSTDNTGAQITSFPTVSSFLTTGFTATNFINNIGNNLASWTFRKQPKFFDVVTWTGNGANRSIAHNLGSAPGCIIIKCTSTAKQWTIWHRAGTQLNNFCAYFTTGGYIDQGTSTWGTNGGVPSMTSTTFSLGFDGEVNQSGATYVAYLFAHNAGGFGLTGTDNVISCGSYTGNGSATGPSINLGYEPQWLLVKSSTQAYNWLLIDTMRGMPVGGSNAQLEVNNSNAEAAGGTYFSPTATGFNLTSTSAQVNQSGQTYIYIAIRRGPMKVPTSGTSVFSPQLIGAPTGTNVTTGFPIDLQIYKNRDGGSNYTVDRLRGVSTSSTAINNPYLVTEATSAEVSTSTRTLNWRNTGFQIPSAEDNITNIFWNFRRAPSFFDEVCYNRASGATVTHNLGVTPELLIVKRRGGVEPWGVMRPNTTGYLLLNATDALSTGLSATATSTTFTLGAGAFDYSDNYVAYLFATCAGVSKCFSYTGNGSSQTINCGFTGGARWILIKRTDSTGDWYVWDSARGIVSANDPHLSLNTTAAEVTTDDTVDTDSTGFVVNQVSATNVNVSSATYIGIAIA